MKRPLHTLAGGWTPTTMESYFRVVVRLKQMAVLIAVALMIVSCKSKEAPPQASSTPAASSSADQAATQAALAEAAKKAKVQEAFANVPDEKAWVSAPESNVAGASGLSCQTKIVGDWVRVYCHGKNAKGGMPTSVAVVANSDDVTKAATYQGPDDGVALLFAHQSGTHLEAVFSWTDSMRKLTLDWPSTGKPPFKAAFAAFTGTITPVSIPTTASLDRAPLIPVRASVEDLIANAKAYKGKLVSVLGWQNGTVDTYMGMGEGLYPDEDSLNDIFFKTSELSPDERKMLIRGACHVVVVGEWDGGMIETWSVRKTTGAENGALIQQMINDEANRLQQKGF